MKTESPKTDHRDKGQHEHIKQDFRKAADNVWDTQVRTALIFNKELFFCRGCLAFFSRDDGPHDHPSDQLYLVTQLCVYKNISSEQSFFFALWSEAVALLPTYGKILMPRFSNQHLQPPAVKPDIKADNTAPWLHARIHLLEQEVHNLTQQIRQLSADNIKSKNQNDQLLEQLLRIKNNQESTQWRALHHIQQLQALITPDFPPEDLTADINK